MAARIRKQIYIEPAQETKLKRLAESTGRSEAEVVRSALDQYLASAATPVQDGSTWNAILSFIEARSAPALVESKRIWTREELHGRSEPVCGSK